MTTIDDANFALQKVLDAGSKKNVIELAWINNVRVTIPRAIVTLSIPSFANSQRDRIVQEVRNCLLYTSPSPRDRTRSRMPSSA